MEVNCSGKGKLSFPHGAIRFTAQLQSQAVITGHLKIYRINNDN